MNARDFLAMVDAALVWFSAKQVQDPLRFAHKLRKQSDPVSAFLWLKLPEPDQIALRSDARSRSSQRAAVKALNSAIRGECIYETHRFQGIELRPQTIDLLKQGSPSPNLARLNRLLLEDAYPRDLMKTLKTEQAACHRCHACWCCYEPTYVDEREVDYMLEALTPEQIDEVTKSTRAMVAARASPAAPRPAQCPGVAVPRSPLPFLKRRTMHGVRSAPIQLQDFFRAQ